MVRVLFTLCSDRYIQNIFFVKHKLVTWPSQSIDILIQTWRTGNNVLLADHECVTAPADEASQNIVVSKLVALALFSHIPVMVRTAAQV